MTYILLNLAATLAFIFFTFYIDKKLSIEASEQNAFSITMLTATIESVIYFFVLLFKNMWLSSLVTPLMKIIFALEGILFVNFSFALLSMATDTKKFLVKLLKYTLCVLAIYIAWWQFKTIDISNDKGIVIASNFLFEEPARNFFPWDWVFVFNAVFKFIIPIFALLFVALIQEKSSTQIQRYQTMLTGEAILFMWIIHLFIKFISSEISKGQSKSSLGVLVVGSLKSSNTEKLAHIALDMALQRGGDQAVVKLEDEVLFFGGRTNAVQKRTKVRARVVANELAMRIAKSSNVIVMAHAFPDYDAIGASVGMARLAKFCGTRVNIVTNFKDINVKKMLKHFDGIEEYKNVFVDSSKALDLVKADTLLIIVDVNNINMFESKDIARMVDNVIIIDHHRKTAEYEKEPIISYIETSASSASEIVSEILEQALHLSQPISAEANALYAGILLDTKHFTKGAGTKTHAAAMYLRDNGASYENVQDLFKSNIQEYKKEASFGEKIEIYRNCMAIALNPYGKDNSDRIMAAKVADNLLGLEDVSASFVLVQIDNIVHISARSNGTVNVQLILEKLNGGGRYDAAGAQVKGTGVADTLYKLKEAIDEYINPED